MKQAVLAVMLQVVLLLVCGCAGGAMVSCLAMIVTLPVYRVPAVCYRDTAALLLWLQDRYVMAVAELSLCGTLSHLETPAAFFTSQPERARESSYTRYKCNVCAKF